ncbi:hypothetical protein RDWZM_006858 [Blomia tropicalis]|uniref:Uncharacterized protein n=1 Tax=Blomia tropicalis TaxID=40697 RepID=A0A9Q0RNT2_BLOTA|nr:hypothetical protein RDWZM_006858 [Blomia tropicalis]
MGGNGPSKKTFNDVNGSITLRKSPNVERLNRLVSEDERNFAKKKNNGTIDSYVSTSSSSSSELPPTPPPKDIEVHYENVQIGDKSLYAKKNQLYSKQQSIETEKDDDDDDDDVSINIESLVADSENSKTEPEVALEPESVITIEKEEEEEEVQEKESKSLSNSEEVVVVAVIENDQTQQQKSNLDQSENDKIDSNENLTTESVLNSLDEAIEEMDNAINDLSPSNVEKERYVPQMLKHFENVKNGQVPPQQLQQQQQQDPNPESDQNVVDTDSLLNGEPQSNNHQVETETAVNNNNNKNDENNNNKDNVVVLRDEKSSIQKTEQSSINEESFDHTIKNEEDNQKRPKILDVVTKVKPPIPKKSAKVMRRPLSVPVYGANVEPQCAVYARVIDQIKQHQFLVNISQIEPTSPPPPTSDMESVDTTTAMAGTKTETAGATEK